MCMLLLIIDIKCTIYFGILRNYAIFVLKQNHLLIIISFSFITGKVGKQPTNSRLLKIARVYGIL